MKDNTSLKKMILNEINAQNGTISFARYMELALYAPEHGYYTSKQQKFGAAGDFVTAPLISPLYSQCIAEQCVEVLQNLMNGNILEFGAGTGKMAADILLALEMKNALPEKYFIIEISPTLKKRQRATLIEMCPHLLPRVEWLCEVNFTESLTHSKLKSFNGIILANEVLDAMPVHRFTVQENTFQEICVKVDNKNELNDQCSSEHNLEICYAPENAKSQSNIVLQKELANLNDALLEIYGALPWEPGYQSEINLQIRPWIKAISNFLDTGVILLIDYGYPRAEYYHPQRNMGTLRCHMNHQVHDDPLYAPGLQDITAHVDFTAVAEAAVECDLDVLGYTNQAAFLLSCGLLELANTSHDVEDTQHLKKSVIQNAAIQQLTSPQAMGELFKVMALGRNYDFSLQGFRLSDKRYTL